MLKAGSSQFINRPIDEVFLYVADQTKTTSWCLGMTDCRLTSDGGMNSGAKRHVEVKSSLGTAAWDFDLEVYKPNEVMVWRDDEASIPMVDTYAFESRDGGTVFSHFNEYGKLPLFLRLLRPLFLTKANHTIKKDNLELKSILENK